MSTCERCGAAFSCAMVDGAGDAPCWCTALPAAVALPEAAGAACWCPDCLRKHIATLSKPAQGSAATAKDSNAI